MNNSKQTILANMTEAIDALAVARKRVSDTVGLFPEDSAAQSGLIETFRAMGVERNKLKGRREQFTLELS